MAKQTYKLANDRIVVIREMLVGDYMKATLYLTGGGDSDVPNMKGWEATLVESCTYSDGTISELEPHEIAGVITGLAGKMGNSLSV